MPAKRTVSSVRLDQPGDVATVLRVLYLVFNEGYSGDVDLAGEAIRLTRRLALPRHTAAAAYLHERAGDPVTAARLYAEAARSAPNLFERDHLARQAARLNAQLRR